MVNIVIAHSQQKNNKCAMGDNEQAHMSIIARGLYDLLRADNRLNVYLIPYLDTGKDRGNLVESVRLSNKFIRENGGTGYHLELHSDAGNYGDGASGLYVSDAGRQFITPIMEELMIATPWPDVGIRKRTNLLALNGTIAIAGLIEISFHDDPIEAKWIHDNLTVLPGVLLPGIYRGIGMEPVEKTDWKAKYFNLKRGVEDILSKM